MKKKDKLDLLESVYTEMRPKMVKFARNSLNNDVFAAQDAVQEAFLVAHVKLNKFASSKNPQGWMMNTLHNIIGDIMRRRQRTIQLFHSADNMDRYAAPSQSTLFEYEGLIKDEDFQLLYWVDCLDVKYQEAADRLGITVDACKKRVERAKKRLEKELQK